MKEPRSRKTKQRKETSVPSRDEVAKRAYELFLKRGSKPGHEQEDWLQAEKSLREERVRPS